MLYSVHWYQMVRYTSRVWNQSSTHLKGLPCKQIHRKMFNDGLISNTIPTGINGTYEAGNLPIIMTCFSLQWWCFTSCVWWTLHPLVASPLTFGKRLFAAMHAKHPASDMLLHWGAKRIAWRLMACPTRNSPFTIPWHPYWRSSYHIQISIPFWMWHSTSKTPLKRR